MRIGIRGWNEVFKTVVSGNAEKIFVYRGKVILINDLCSLCERGDVRKAPHIRRERVRGGLEE
jgi:hypothetical protein